MKVLFVTSGNSKYHNIMPAFIRSQADSLIEEGVELDFYQIKGKGVIGYLKNIAPLRRKLKSHSYDIIHAHYGFCGVVSALARKDEKIVVSFMGESEFTPEPEDRLNPMLWLAVFLHRFFSRFIFDYTILKSPNIARFVKGIQKKSSILPNGVNLDLFKPLEKESAREYLKLPRDKKIILWIGNTDRKVKGFSFANKAITKVSLKYPNIHFLYINNIPNELLPYYYSASDVFLLTSLSEGSPNVIKEAMACNTPIVSTPVGDVQFLFENTRMCYCSTGFSPEEIAELLFSVIEKDERSNGRERIIALGLDLESTAKKLLSIYSLQISS